MSSLPYTILTYCSLLGNLPFLFEFSSLLSSLQDSVILFSIDVEWFFLLAVTGPPSWVTATDRLEQLGMRAKVSEHRQDGSKYLSEYSHLCA